MDAGTQFQIFVWGSLFGAIVGLLFGAWLWHKGSAGQAFRGWTAAIFSSQETASQSETPPNQKPPSNMPEAVNKMTDAMAKAMSALPKIQEAGRLFSTLSKSERDALAMNLGVEYQQGMTQLTATELEAVSKLREIGLRFSLYLNKVKLVAVSAPAELEVALDSIVELEKIATERTTQLTTPEWKGVAQATQAQKAAEFLREVAHVPDTMIKDVTAPFLALPEEKVTIEEPEIAESEIVEDDENPFAATPKTKFSSNGHNHTAR